MLIKAKSFNNNVKSFERQYHSHFTKKHFSHVLDVVQTKALQGYIPGTKADHPNQLVWLRGVVQPPLRSHELKLLLRARKGIFLLQDVALRLDLRRRRYFFWLYTNKFKLWIKITYISLLFTFQHFLRPLPPSICARIAFLLHLPTPSEAELFLNNRAL